MAILILIAVLTVILVRLNNHFSDTKKIKAEEERLRALKQTICDNLTSYENFSQIIDTVKEEINLTNSMAVRLWVAAVLADQFCLLEASVKTFRPIPANFFENNYSKTLKEQIEEFSFCSTVAYAGHFTYIDNQSTISKHVLAIVGQQNLFLVRMNKWEKLRAFLNTNKARTLIGALADAYGYSEKITKVAVKRLQSLDQFNKLFSASIKKNIHDKMGTENICIIPLKQIFKIELTPYIQANSKFKLHKFPGIFMYCVTLHYRTKRRKYRKATIRGFEKLIYVDKDSFEGELTPFYKSIALLKFDNGHFLPQIQSRELEQAFYNFFEPIELDRLSQN